MSRFGEKYWKNFWHSFGPSESVWDSLKPWKTQRVSGRLGETKETHKGSKKIMHTVPEVYFFHFINESSSYLTTEIKYPHWTTYIVGSRDHIVVSGSYPSPNGTDCHRLIRYDNFFQTIVFCLNKIMQIFGVPTFMFIIVLEIFRLMNCSETCLGKRSEP